jgi:tRNA threonylcarbamoyladenosine biosynthesis protein TsaE
MQESVSNSEEETISAATDLIKSLPKKTSLICLFGDLGSGKTVFVKGMAKALEIENYTIKSPTYTFVREYIHKKGKLIHVDLYRLDAPDDLLIDQIEEFLGQPSTLVVIEWADRIKDNLNDLAEKRTDICLEYIDKDKRKITIF